MSLKQPPDIKVSILLDSKLHISDIQYVIKIMGIKPFYIILKRQFIILILDIHFLISIHI